jgi:prophage antirepressor-like protein
VVIAVATGDHDVDPSSLRAVGIEVHVWVPGQDLADALGVSR